MSSSQPPSGPRTLLVVGSVASVALWLVPGAQLIVYPIRLLVTLFHEAAHALATVLTGGTVHALMIDPSGNGLTQSMGGNPLAITPAGYLGTTALGALLILAARPRNGRGTLYALAVITGVATLGWARDAFSIMVGLLLCICLALLARHLPPRGSDFVAAFLGVQLCLNALMDLRILVTLSSMGHYRNDAANMSALVGLPPWFWAVSWMMLSLVILFLALRKAWSSRRS